MKKIFTLIAALFMAIAGFGQAPRTVCFELFSGENCPPCAATNPYVYSEVNESAGQCILVHYMMPIPTAGTLYYEDEGDENSRGLTFYSVNSTPWGEQDGWLWGTTASSGASGANNPAYWVNSPSYLTNEEAVTSPFTVSVADTFSSTADSFYVAVTITGAQSFTSTGTLKLVLAMVENLQYEYPIGNNGEVYFPNVVRKMYPSSAGTTLPASWTNGETKTYTFGGVFPSYIRDKTQVNFVAMVQDLGNKFIEQTAISNPFTFSTDLAAVSLNGQFGNCYSSQYKPAVNIANLGLTEVSECYISEYLDGNFIDSSLYTINLQAGNSIVQTLNPIDVTPGVHTVKVNITSPDFGTDPNPANNTYSMIIDAADSTVNTPLTEGFENGDPAVNGGWAVEDVCHDSTWRVVTTGYNSAHGYMIDFADDLSDDFYGSSTRDIYDYYENPVNNLYSPPLNLTHISHAVVSFNFAQQFLNFGGGDIGGDSLYIDVSSDCGATWTTVHGLGSTTAGEQSVTSSFNIFVPTSSADWGLDSADISVVANHDNVLLRFRPVFEDGNDFYLDNINIHTSDSVPYTPPTAINEVQGIQSLNIYPNPANTQINVVMTLDNNAEVSYQLTDVAGNTIAAQPAEVRSSGVNNFTINTASLSAGVYFVNITAGTQRASKMIAVMH